MKSIKYNAGIMEQHNEQIFATISTTSAIAVTKSRDLDDEMIPDNE